MDSFSSSALDSSLSLLALDNLQLDGNLSIKDQDERVCFRMFDSDQTNEMVRVLNQVSNLYIQAMGWDTAGDPGGGEKVWE